VLESVSVNNAHAPARNKRMNVQRPRLPPSIPAATDGGMMAVEKTLRLESTKRFPLSHRHDDGC